MDRTWLRGRPPVEVAGRLLHVADQLLHQERVGAEARRAVRLLRWALQVQIVGAKGLRRTSNIRRAVREAGCDDALPCGDRLSDASLDIVRAILVALIKPLPLAVDQQLMARTLQLAQDCKIQIAERSIGLAQRLAATDDLLDGAGGLGAIDR